MEVEVERTIIDFPGIGTNRLSRYRYQQTSHNSLSMEVEVERTIIDFPDIGTNRLPRYRYQ